MHVLIQDRVHEEARVHLRHLLGGSPLVWDAPPMAQSTWRCFAGVSSGISQVVRLFGKEVGFDQWGQMRRLTLTTLSWDPLPYDFGWMVICRPFGGVTFQQDPSTGVSPLIGMRYLTSWPHGYLLRDELTRFVPMLRERLIDQILRLYAKEEDAPTMDRNWLEATLLHADELAPSDFVDIFGMGDPDDIECWQMQRALILLSSAQAAMRRDRDLVCLGF